MTSFVKIFSLFLIVLTSIIAQATTNAISIHTAKPVSGSNVISTAPLGTTFYVAWTFTTSGSVPASGVLQTDGDGSAYGDIIVKQSSSPTHVSGNQYYIVFDVEIDPNQNLNISRSRPCCNSLKL